MSQYFYFRSAGVGLWFPEIINQISNKIIGSTQTSDTICGILKSSLAPNNSTLEMNELVSAIK